MASRAAFAKDNYKQHDYDVVIIVSSSDSELSTYPLSEDEAPRESMICVRYDFDKEDAVVPPPSTILLSSEEEEDDAAPRPANSRQNVNNNNALPVVGAKEAQNNGHRKSHETPLSPESQKKELCSYLQLMKPCENRGKQQMLCERKNRRSIRVRNLQKEENETKRKSREDGETITKDVAVNKSMPLPSSAEYYETIQDFEEAISDLIKSYHENQEKENKSAINTKLQQNKLTRNRKNGEKTKKVQTKTKIYLNKSETNLKLNNTNNMRRKLKMNLRKTTGNLAKLLKPSSKPKVRTKVKENPVKLYRFPRNRSKRRLRSENNMRNLTLRQLLGLDRILIKKKKINTKKKRPSEAEPKKLDLDNLRKEINDKMRQDEKSADETRQKRKKSQSILEETEEEETIVIQMESPKEQPRPMKRKNSNGALKKDQTIIATIRTYLEHNYAQNDSVPIPKIGAEEAPTPPLESAPKSTEIAEISEISNETITAAPLEDNIDIIPVITSVKYSLHRSLNNHSQHTNQHSPKKKLTNGSLQNWNSLETAASQNKKLNHFISISPEAGDILKIFYQDHHLVLVQHNSVTMWTQSALGNVLGAQNMWIPNGQTQRLPLSNNATYIQKETKEMVITTGDNVSVAYVELWIKEHKSDYRERPLADVFVTVYFWRVRQGGVDKKALQLESIQSSGKDVQYVVLKQSPRICVSWYAMQPNKTESMTKIRLYYLAADYQTVARISEIQAVSHYVSSLHNIEDCDNLIMGCGDNKLTLWNLEYGYVVATIDLLDLQPAISTQWIKSDRGFLFLIQECEDSELRLMAINGMNHSWKKLQNYQPPKNVTGLKGVYMENGLLVAYYSQRIICWNAQSGKLLMDDVFSNNNNFDCKSYVPSHKFLILINDEQIIVRHSMNHLISGNV